NAADIKLAVDAMELAFVRDYVSTFVIGTGDSDFTPLVHKLRELNKRVIGVGVEQSTSALLPPACDEFLYYNRLEGVEPPSRPRRGRPAPQPAAARTPAPAAPTEPERAAAADRTEPAAAEAEQGKPTDAEALAELVAQTVAGMQRCRRTGDRLHPQAHVAPKG